MLRRLSTAILAFVALALAGCAAGRWERANTSVAETDAILADCASIERANTTTFNYMHRYRTRDGRTETMLMPERLVAPGKDIGTCMRQRGFIRVPVEPPRVADAE